MQRAPTSLARRPLLSKPLTGRGAASVSTTSSRSNSPTHSPVLIYVPHFLRHPFPSCTSLWLPGTSLALHLFPGEAISHPTAHFYLYVCSGVQSCLILCILAKGLGDLVTFDAKTGDFSLLSLACFSFSSPFRLLGIAFLLGRQAECD